MKVIQYILLLLMLGAWSPSGYVSAQKVTTADVKNLVFEHVNDSYEWHITNIGHTRISIPLPVIVYSRQSGWHVFLSSRLLTAGSTYQGLSIAGESSPYAGKIVEHTEAGAVRPLDLSITKDVLSLLISSVLLIVVVLYTAHWYRRRKESDASPGGFVGFMEMFIMMVHDDVIKDNIGPRYRKFAPYLLTVFFFILVNNYMGIIPLFPGGANVTGNIAVTFVLAVTAFIAINVPANRAYWKDLFWPDVPLLLKFPIPMMQMIELLSLFIKPFALMVRLFANMLSGHISVVVLLSLIFIGASMPPVMQGGLSVIGFLFSLFLNALELLVGFIQAYVFTILTAAFIGLAQNNEEEEEVKQAIVKP